MGNIRNINGALATGSDFFGREPELLRLARILLTDSLLVTPYPHLLLWSRLFPPFLCIGCGSTILPA